MPSLIFCNLHYTYDRRESVTGHNRPVGQRGALWKVQIAGREIARRVAPIRSFIKPILPFLCVKMAEEKESKQKSLEDTSHPPSAASTASAAAATAASSATSTDASSSPSGAPKSLASSYAELNESENIWSHILKKSTRKVRDTPGSIVVIGDAHSGKGSLLHKLSDRVYFPAVTADGQPALAAAAAGGAAGAQTGHFVVDYSFLFAKNKLSADKDEVLAHVNVWSIDDPAHLSALFPILFHKQTAPTHPSSSPNHASAQQNQTKGGPSPSSPLPASSPLALSTPSIDIAALETTVFLLCFDLSEPWKIQKSITKWTSALQSLMVSVYSKVPVAEEQRLKQKISKVIQSYYAGAAALSSPDVTPCFPYLPIDLSPHCCFSHFFSLFSFNSIVSTERLHSPYQLRSPPSLCGY